MTRILNTTTLVVLALLAVAVVYLLAQPVHNAEAGVNISNDYRATSTAASTIYGATITGSQVIKPEPGAIGEVTITGATAGIVNLYDATTTDITKRAASMSTSTILIASFPASTAAGSYELNSSFRYGLYIQLVSGTMPTSTISYR